MVFVIVIREACSGTRHSNNRNCSQIWYTMEQSDLKQAPALRECDSSLGRACALSKGTPNSGSKSHYLWAQLADYFEY